MAKFCIVCGEKIGLITGRVDFDDGSVCTPCWKKAGFGTSIDEINKSKRYSGKDIKRMVDIRQNNESLIRDFHATKQIRELAFDDTKQMILFTDHVGLKNQKHIIMYNQLQSFRLLEDGANVVSANIGNAVVGGIMFGDKGAIVGAMTKQKVESVCTSIILKINLQNHYLTSIEVPFLAINSKRNSMMYKTAKADAELVVETLQKAMTMVTLPKSERYVRTDSVRWTSATDEILKFKQLLDAGIITEEEFQAKKKQLLGL